MGQVFLAPLLQHPKNEGMFLALLQGGLANSAGVPSLSSQIFWSLEPTSRQAIPTHCLRMGLGSHQCV